MEKWDSTSSGWYVVNNTPVFGGGAGGGVPAEPGRSASESKNAYAACCTMSSPLGVASSSLTDELGGGGVSSASK